MKLFDILGPIMVGPSSSHTAGAVKIGLVTRKLLGEPPVSADIFLYGSFVVTGVGHGTDRALVAGLLGMKPDDMRIPDSFTAAKEAGLTYSFGEADLKEAHPNTAVIRAKGASGSQVSVEACSLGGGRIEVRKLDGIETVFDFEYHTMIVYNEDKPGYIAQVTTVLEQWKVNIATMRLCRSVRGGVAVMVLECDEPIPETVTNYISVLPGIVKVRTLNLKEEADV